MSVVFHVIIVILLLAIIGMLIVGYLTARHEINTLKPKVDDVISKANAVYARTSNIDFDALVAQGNSIYARTRNIDFDALVAQVSSIDMLMVSTAAKINGMCSKTFPFGIGQLC